MREQQVIRTVSAIVAVASIGAALLLSVGAARAGELRVKGGLPGDWFVPDGNARFTGGLTRSRYSLDLLANGSGGSIAVGNTRDLTASADGFKVTVRLPSSMPYLGLGWGHQGHGGLRFSFKFGAPLGNATLSPPLADPWAQRVALTDIDAGLPELRVGMGKVRLAPQRTVAMGSSF